MGVPVTNNSLFIDLKTKEYPLYLHDVKQRTGAYIPLGTDSDQLIPFGFDVVRLTDKPKKGDVITEIAPNFDEEKGYWVQVWEVRDYTPDELNEIFERRRQELLSEMHNKYEYEQMQSREYMVGEAVFNIRFSQEFTNELIGPMAAAVIAPAEDTLIKMFDAHAVLHELTSKDIKGIIAMIHEVRVKGRINFIEYFEKVNGASRQDGLPSIPPAFIVFD